jgi:hypothetical protein
MSRYTQKPYTAEERNAAVVQFAEKIIYSPRYSGEWHAGPRASLQCASSHKES